MNRFLPSFRLLDVARRLLAQQPEPPRRVSLSDMLEIWGPILVYLYGLIPVVALIGVLLKPPSGRLSTVELFALGFIAVGLVIGWTMLTMRRGLQSGVTAVGEVVATGNSGRTKVLVKGREIEKVDILRITRQLQVGDRITVLMNESQEKILLMLEAVKT
jgi:hypothetical protein